MTISILRARDRQHTRTVYVLILPVRTVLCYVNGRNRFSHFSVSYRLPTTPIVINDIIIIHPKSINISTPFRFAVRRVTLALLNERGGGGVEK